MRIAHECPLSVFDRVQETTDYDYFLVHLFEENEAYWNKATEAVAKGRHVILDNSIFELGEAFDSERFVHWINKLVPTEYIIPDVLEDAFGTIKNLHEWKDLYQDRVAVPSTCIGVVQAESYDQFEWCYREVEPLVEKVAISFDYSMFSPGITSNLDFDQMCRNHMVGRQTLLRDLNDRGVVNKDKPHHLLGCFLPQEFAAYRDYDWIDTLDTSNPVVAGIKGIRYDGTNGLERKPMQKLYTLMDAELTDQQKADIDYNISMFRGIVNG